MSNTITAYFKGRIGVAEAVYQNDYGIVMAFDSIDLPAHFECFFSKLNQEEAVPGLGADSRVAIPNSVLADPGNVTIHIPLHTGEDDSEVEYVVYFKVIGRARPIDDGTPTQMTAIERALALLSQPITNIEEIVNEALSFTGDTFDEMKAELQDDFDEYTETLEGDLATWKGGVESDIDDVEHDFTVLQNQFDTAVAAVSSDTELTDIRVGDDEVTYTTAGLAVRTQFANVKSAIKKFAFDTDYLGLVSIVESSYVTTTGTFESHTLLDRTDYVEIPTGTKYIKVFAGLPSGNNVYPLNDCVAYYNSEKSFIGTCGASQSRTELSTYEVPSDASYVVVNTVKQRLTPDLTALIFVSANQIVEELQTQTDAEATARTASIQTLSDTQPLNPTWISGGYYNANGNLSTNSAFSYTDKIAIGDIDRIEFIGGSVSALANIIFFNNDTVWGYKVGKGSEYDIQQVVAHAPKGTTHYALSKLNSSIINEFAVHNSESVNDCVDIYKRTLPLGYINLYGVVTNQWTSKYFDISPQIILGNTKQISYNLCAIPNMSVIAFYTEDGTFISGVSATASNPTLLKGIVDVPSNAYSMSFCYVNSSYATSIDFSQCHVTLLPTSSSDSLQEKKWLAIGDSITAGETNNSKSYVDYLNGFITTEKEGHSGYSLLTLYQLRESFPTDADIVTIFAGTNDFNVSRPLGVITDMETTPTKLTFYGEVNQFMKWAVETFPIKPVIFVTPIWRNATVEGNISGMVDNNGVDLHEYCEAIQACGKKYGVIVADFMNESGFGEYNIAQLTNDGLHPNDVGQKRLATLFKALLKKYL